MNRFKRFRLLADMTMEEAAQRLGISRGSISQWENARTLPHSFRLRKIADVYGCTIADLLGDNGEARNEKQS
ncbi:MAG: helix-turn-helix transcriptional regulator [Oscillibacter sp.]|nr:helix-turn-helix transcriptional regulator [Oscillibacter sp.]